MKKVLLIIVLILVSVLGVLSQVSFVEDKKVDFFYIRARDFQKPSNEVRTDAGKALVEAIKNSKQTIDFAFYGLSKQDEILEALIKAQNRGVKIRGIVDTL